MVDATLEDLIESMFVGEEQMYNENTGKYTRAENLDTVHTKEEPAVPSNIWADYQLQSFGDPMNAQPTTLSSGTSTVSSLNAIRLNENMGMIEQARVREWSKNIDVCADPTQAIGVSALSEPGIDEPVSKRVVANSDSDEEDNAAEETMRRIVAEDSDDEVASPVVTKISSSAPRNLLDSRPQQSSDIGQTISNTRTSRADRPKDDVPLAPGNHGTRNTTNFVAAGSFFADVPRDEEGVGEVRFKARSSAVQSNTNVTPEPTQRNTRRTRPSRGFGFDGAADEYDPDENQSLKEAHSPPKSSINGRVPVMNTTQQSDQTGAYRTGPQFDPNRYGVHRREERRDSGRTYPLQQNTFSTGQPQPRPVPTWPQPPVRADLNAGSQRRGAPSAQVRRTQDQLIDLPEDTRHQPANLMPPPGLSPRRRLDEADTIESSHLLDSPLEEIQKPSIKPSWDDNLVSHEPSVSTSSSSGTRHLVLEYNVQTKVNKPDIGYMRNSMVDQLMAIQQKRKVKKEQPVRSGTPSERIDPDDEATSRKFYSTMNLRAPNTGKGKKGRGGGLNSSNGETPAQAAERLAKVKAELGLTSVPSRNPQPRPQSTEKEKLSKKAQQAAKQNLNMAQLHAGSLKEASRKKIAQDFIEHMKEAYEIARLFPGHVEFEFQIGQLLVMPSRVKPGTVYETEKWKKMFNSGVTSAEVFFTNLLTTSGSDVDGILEAKTDRTKTWSKEVPGPCSIVLEFECLDSSGSEFKLHLNTDGTYSISKDLFVIQQIGLQCPGRTWDTCAILKGVPALKNLPDMLQSSVTDLIASVYMRPGDQVDVFFRTPSDNSITVREVTVKRMSKHDSQLPGEKDVKLKIVEVKTLYMTNHKKDKRLTRCSEKEHDQMAQEDRVHYEVSVIDCAINASLEKNQSLEVGEMTSLNQPDSSPLNHRRTQCVLDAALRLVDKIDWVGGHNLGTIVQRQYLRVRKEEEAARSMPPTMLDHSFLRPVHLPTGLSVAGSRSMAGTRTAVGSNAGGNAQMSVHGIRSGTKAQIVTDMRGNFFRIGFGGARIPLDSHEEESMIGDGLAPDDSASQIGGSRRNPRQTEVRPDSFW